MTTEFLNLEKGADVKVRNPAIPRTGLLAVVVLSIATMVGPSTAAAMGLTPASKAIEKVVRREKPQARQIFVNCPGNNVVPAGIGCEFRFIAHGAAYTGHAVATPDDDRLAQAHWSGPQSVSYHRNPTGWRRCSIHGTAPRYSSAETVFVDVNAASCSTARRATVNAIRFAHFHSLRIPAHFSYQQPGRNELGFVINRFGCSGNVRVRQGNPNPYGEETGFCSNRFGDRFEFRFLQGS